MLGERLKTLFSWSIWVNFPELSSEGGVSIPQTIPTHTASVPASHPRRRYWEYISFFLCSHCCFTSFRWSVLSSLITTFSIAMASVPIRPHLSVPAVSKSLIWIKVWEVICRSSGTSWALQHIHIHTRSEPWAKCLPFWRKGFPDLWLFLDQTSQSLG